MQQINWDNLRYVLMVANKGSIAAESGIGLALLPQFLGDESKKLTRLEAATRELTTGLGLLTHPDLVRSARVHAFIEHFSAALGSP